MIVEHVVGHLPDEAVAASGYDAVDIAWRQTVRRALRLVARSGRRVDVLLPPGGRLRHGDLLGPTPDGRPILVQVTPCEVAVLQPGSIEAMGLLATELGNLHLPVEIASGHLITLDDGPVREIAGRLGITVEIRQRRFHPLPGSVQSPLGPQPVYG